jgi:outer membrane PBP1 activator LpoA protein
MKELFLTLTVAVFMVGAILSGCQSSTKSKVEEAEQSLDAAQFNLEVAQHELIAARKEYHEDYQLFKKEYDEKLRQNEFAIAELKAMIAMSSEQNKPILERELADLEKKNRDLKLSLENYNKSGKDNWERFKVEFKDSMNDLGESIGNLFSSE